MAVLSSIAAPLAIAGAAIGTGGISLLPSLAIAGAAASATGAITGGIASEQQANYAAQVAKNNETTALANKQYSLEAGSAQEEVTGLKAAASLGAVKTAQAAGGVGVNTGSNVAVQESQRISGTLSEENVAENAALQAYGYGTQATSYESEAALEKATAANAIPGALLSATGSTLTAAGTLPGKFASLGNQNPGSVYDPDSGLLGPPQYDDTP
jgi:hypothetical protein